jgi:hypothetical protein
LTDLTDLLSTRLARRLMLAFVVNPSDVVFHVVHAREDTAALLAFGASPLAFDARVMLGFVAGAVFLAGEATAQWLVGRLGSSRGGGLTLGAAVDAAEQVLAVAVVVLA